jgi:hypothetical protein
VKKIFLVSLLLVSGLFGSDEQELLEKYAPILYFADADYMPRAIDDFISHSMLVRKSDEKVVGFGKEALTWTNFFKSFNPNKSDIKIWNLNISSSLDFLDNENETYYLDFLNGANGGKDFDYNDLMKREVPDQLKTGEGSLNQVFYHYFNPTKSFSPYEINKNASPTIYGNVLKQDGKTYLQYYFFYFINEWNGNGGLFKIGYHEGDWEFMAIELDENNEPLRISSSVHVPGANINPISKNGGLTLEWDYIETDNTKNHPKVYIGQGGHPTYLFAEATQYAVKQVGYLAKVLFGIDYHYKKDIAYVFQKGLSGLSEEKELKYEVINIEENQNAKNWLSANIVWGHLDKDLLSLYQNEKIEPAVKSPLATFLYGDHKGDTEDGRWGDTKTWMDNRVPAESYVIDKFKKNETVIPLQPDLPQEGYISFDGTLNGNLINTNVGDEIQIEFGKYYYHFEDITNSIQFGNPKVLYKDGSNFGSVEATFENGTLSFSAPSDNFELVSLQYPKEDGEFENVSLPNVLKKIGQNVKNLIHSNYDYSFLSNDKAYTYTGGNHYIVWSLGTDSSNFDENIKLSFSTDGKNWKTQNICYQSSGGSNQHKIEYFGGKFHIIYKPFSGSETIYHCILDENLNTESVEEIISGKTIDIQELSNGNLYYSLYENSKNATLFVSKFVNGVWKPEVISDKSRVEYFGDVEVKKVLSVDEDTVYFFDGVSRYGELVGDVFHTSGSNNYSLNLNTHLFSYKNGNSVYVKDNSIVLNGKTIFHYEKENYSISSVKMYKSNISFTAHDEFGNSQNFDLFIISKDGEILGSYTDKKSFIVDVEN